MSQTSRAAHRALLVVIALGWFAAAALMIAWALRIDLPAWLPQSVGATIARIDPVIVGFVAAGIGALCWLLHLARRGRGRTSDAVRVGPVVLDRAVVNDAVTTALREETDVLGSNVTT